MAETADRTLPDGEIEEMVRVVRPNWTVHDASLAATGTTPVYHLRVETGDGRANCVLKASANDERRDTRRRKVDTEARILAILDEHTAIPVPSVLGAVDEHDDLRTPYFLMTSMPGTTVSPAEVGSISDGALRRIARETGRHLADLHSLEVESIDAFGYVDYESSSPLAGDRPRADPSRLVVRDGYADWRERFRDWLAIDLDRHADTRFADLTPRLESAMDDMIEDFPESFSPVLGRVYHDVDNLLVEPEEGSVEALIDWEPRHVVPPAVDLVIAEYLLPGGGRMSLPTVPDRQAMVREAIRAGYGEIATLPPKLAAQWDCYQLDNLIVSMIKLDAGEFAASEETEEAVAAWLREAAEEILESG